LIRFSPYNNYGEDKVPISSKDDWEEASPKETKSNAMNRLTGYLFKIIQPNGVLTAKK